MNTLDHIDVFKSGLVVADGGDPAITDNGCTLLGALGIIPRTDRPIFVPCNR